ncbi:Protein sumv-1 like [Actinidia chinensis var. chinensis]|uniref:Protein sumv-1 like n=1 Tax=Actinidia chinensis var. chinensis TaxID=1590841 RepID=A0A2R6R4V7_ACTCC|nr:Protein sumv-1 like [Actinidia chinensis var. chinensis]
MASSSNVKAAQVDAPPKMPPPGEHTKEVLHQRRKLPYCPARMAIGGFAIVVTLGYFTLYSKKKPEASAADVARVATGVATPENTYPPK